MSDTRWLGHPPAELELDCGGAPHRVRWEDGALLLLDHADPDGERTLAALAREPLPCLRLLDAWEGHRDDLRVLTAGSRGDSDIVVSGLPWGGAPPGATGRGVVATMQRAVVTGRAAGWTGYSGMAVAPRGQHAYLAARFGGADPIGELLTATGPLAGRLVATVAAAWADRARRGDPDVAARSPELEANLYGRVAAALRAWIGTPPGAVRVAMVAPGEEPRVARDGGGILAALPFTWLAEVWSRGLAVVLGRFVLAAEAEGGELRLHTVDTTLSRRETLAIRF